MRMEATVIMIMEADLPRDRKKLPLAEAFTMSPNLVDT